MAYYSRSLKMPFQEAVDRVIQNLRQQGFGIITTIDLRDTFKRKLNLEFRDYIILGACNPQFAYKAVSLESHMGTILPCNVIVQTHENGEVEVSAVDPVANIDKAFNTTQLIELAADVGNRLRVAIDALGHDPSEKNCDALPTEPRRSSSSVPIQG